MCYHRMLEVFHSRVVDAEIELEMCAGRLSVLYGVWPIGSAVKFEKPTWTSIDMQTLSTRDELVRGIDLL